jgi:hypothetical protein
MDVAIQSGMEAAEKLVLKSLSFDTVNLDEPVLASG